jgi:hypothetical protein
LSWLYRLECDIAKEEINIGAPHDAGIIRSVANIVRGSIKGPGIEAEVLPLGGADWATVVKGTHVTEATIFPRSDKEIANKHSSR